LFNTIKLLEQIQKTDLEISALMQEEGALREEIERVSAAINNVEERITKLGVEIEGLTGSVGEARQRLTDNADKISKHEERLREVKNDRELKAINREKNQATKAKRLIEQDLSAAEAKLAEVQLSLDGLESEGAGKNEELKSIEADLESRKAGWEELLGEKRVHIDKLKVDLAPSIFSKYESIKTRSGGRAVVPVKDEACQGCFIHIPPQVYIQLKRGDEELIMCPHCYRILYVEEETQPAAV
jgi:hypothetical protein